MSVGVTIAIPGTAPPRLADDLADDLGIYPCLVSDGEVRGGELEAVHIVIFAGTGTFIGAMLQQFGTEAANRVLRMIDRLRQAFPEAHPELRLVDETNQVVVMLGPEVSKDPRAITTLLALEREAFLPGVELRWDPTAGRWRARRP